MTAAAARVWLIHADDNVGTVVGADASGPGGLAVIGAQSGTVRLTQPIPHGHKVALRDLQAGADVVKYGVRIGRLTAAVRAGDHVHTHNLESLRGRGDLVRR